MMYLDRINAIIALHQLDPAFQHMTLTAQSEKVSGLLHDYYLKADLRTVPLFDFAEDYLKREKS